ncbi:MAG: hypothetical protein WA144_12500 [Candidatus Methanoperedens sp.]
MDLKLLIESECFSQNFPVKSGDFIRYCRERDVNIDDKILEYLEEKRLFFPIFRTEQYVNSTKHLGNLYSSNLVKEPRNEKFISWETFYTLNEKYNYKELSVISYYSKYQIFYLINILNMITIKLTLDKTKNDDTILIKAKQSKEKFLERFANKNDFNTFLFNYIQNKYLPKIRDSRYIVLTNIEWEQFERLTTLIDIKILKEKEISIDYLKRIRSNFALEGLSIDPLKNWYDLVKYISHEKREKLKGKALLAQDYYIVSDMLKRLIEDLTCEEQLETSLINDAMEGRGYIRVYGKKLNYKDIDILKRLVADYRIDPKPDLLLIVEGDSEEVAIPIILSAFDITLEQFRIEMYNIKGVDRNMDELIKYVVRPPIIKIDETVIVSPNRTKIYGLFDNEGRFRSKKPEEIIETIMVDLLRSIPETIEETTIDILKKETIKIKLCDNSFEYDNFTDEELSSELNKYGKKYGYQFNITPDEVGGCRKINKNLDKFIREKTLYQTSLNKKEFGKLIGKFIADEIKSGKKDRAIIDILDDVIEFAKLS